MKFKVGDRVAVYGQSQAMSKSAVCITDTDDVMRSTGKVVAVVDKNRINVDCDGCDQTHTFHVRQCRRLVKRERRRVKAQLLASGAWIVEVVAGKFYPGQLSEFIEVRKREGM